MPHPSHRPVRSFALGAFGALAALATAGRAQEPVPGGAPGTSKPATKPATPEAPEEDCCHAPVAPLAGALPMDRKSVKLREIADKLNRSHAPFFGEQALRDGEAQVAKIDASTAPADEMQRRTRYGELLTQYGWYAEAIEQYTRVHELAEASDDARTVRQMLKELGIASMRLGERANCVKRHNADSCLFPLKDGAIHVERTGSEQAIGYFTELLQSTPRDNGTAWLLNVAAMTLGTYPDAVPKRWRIPPERLVSEHELPRMPDRARELGLSGTNRAGGSVMDDLDGDGRLDLVVSSMDTRTRLRVWLQREPGKFEECGEALGLGGQLGGLQLFHLDADNDGRLDLLVQRGGWMGKSGEIPNSLLIQQKDGTFVDRTQEAGIEIAAPSQSAAFADIDLDGDLDLFLGYEGAGDRYPSKLFRNRGDGTFEDATQKLGIRSCGFVKGCVFGDYDRDGFPDLYVSTMNGPNRLYQNQRGEKFVDVAPALGVTEPIDSFSSFFFDYDQDGWLDLYASGYPNIDRVGATGAYWIAGEKRCELNKLYRNNRLGGFDDVTEEVGLDRVAFPMGSSFGDVDGDGYPEIYLATGAPDYATLFPNAMYRNDRGQRFQEVTSATGTGHLQKGHGVSFGDLDGDGDEDLFVQTGGAYADDTFVNACYENPRSGRHWLTVVTRGTTSNRSGLGARLRLRIAEPSGERDLYAVVGLCSSFGGNSFQEEFGLGDATRIVELEVEWPASRTTQRFTDVPLDTRIVVVEGEAKMAPLTRSALRE
ncbi:MAG: CRTAC1 family protein [Planctomycetes bacterium]|nr:CRTAC1 family protein [Planctomycetota bacterium]